MEDFRLPAPLVGLLKLSKLKGVPEFDIRHKTDSVDVTIYWKKATPAASQKKSTTSKSTSAKTKPPTSKLTTKSTPRAVSSLRLQCRRQGIHLTSRHQPLLAIRPLLASRRRRPLLASRLLRDLPLRSSHLHPTTVHRRAQLKMLFIVTNLPYQCIPPM